MLESLFGRSLLIPLTPGTELVSAFLIVCVLAIVLRKQRKANSATRPRTPKAMRLTAAAIVAAWTLNLAAILFLREPRAVFWWEYALPVGVAAAGILIALVANPRNVRRVGDPAGVGLRRTWRSFTSNTSLTLIATVSVLIVLITVFCGNASSPDEHGRYSILIFGEGGSVSFYGWAYGIPVLIAMIALLTALWVTLHKTATPPFSSPAAVEQETIQRRTVSAATVWVSGAALTLTLGAIMLSLGNSGTAAGGVGIPGVGKFTWQPGFSSFAELFIWSGWVMEVAALVSLTALAVGIVQLKTTDSGLNSDMTKGAVR